MEAALADFLRHCRLERRLADLTCSAYERDVRACLAFLREQGFADLARVRPPDLRAFLATEAEGRPALGSQARTVAALKCFFRFLVENEYLDRDPAHVLRTPKKASTSTRSQIRPRSPGSTKPNWRRLPYSEIASRSSATTCCSGLATTRSTHTRSSPGPCGSSTYRAVSVQ
jgi:Phage integrase, N-terminal SAM-like domain